MKLIGNIVTNTKIEASERFNVITSLDNCIKGIPTIIIGYDLTKELCIDKKINSIYREIEPNLFWTFKKTESRREFEKNIEIFIELCYKNIISGINYFFIDHIQLSQANLIKTYDKLKSIPNLVGYIHEDRLIYLYGDNFIFGIDLDNVSYVNLDSDKLKHKISDFVGGLITTNELPPQYTIDIERFDGNIKYVSYLCYLDGLALVPVNSINCNI